ncbi:unnamed protein product [Thlaspi arvense]|uniref:GH10 domain-containing protein n=1 Tax=Thlaspi arvense TaxID=13288 RepID=A0AAU9RYX4_THLAR|nr:unnamed protein product [Thlaspi arvense]
MDPFSYNQPLKSECLMEPPQTNSTGKEFQELKIKEDVGNRKVLERVYLLKGNIHSISAWVKLRNEYQRTVRITLRGKNIRNLHGGQVMARKGCWSLLKGSFIVDVSVFVDIFFKSDGLADAEISVQNVRLKRFNKTQWRLQQDQAIEKTQIRKNKVRFELKSWRVIAREWFVSRFRLTSFTNEMKWYTNEPVRGQENYDQADSIMKIAEENKILVKGHTVLWDNKNWQPSWVKMIEDPEELKNVTLNRINSVMNRYKGRLIGWDVMNENVHFRYFEDMLGVNASAMIYSLASKLDPDLPLFVNEFNTIEYAREGVGSSINVKRKMEEIVLYPGNTNIKGGIGAQAHFAPAQPNLVYMRSALDTLGYSGFPVWLTEVDMPKCPDQATYMEEILREAYSHPAVKGIILYAGPEVSGFNKLTLADKDFKNTETGDLIDKLLKEWQQEPEEISIQYDEHNDEEEEGGQIIGFSPEISLLHGHYTVTVTNPSMKNFSTSFSFEVTKEMGHLQVAQLEIDA